MPQMVADEALLGAAPPAARDAARDGARLHALRADPAACFWGFYDKTLPPVLTVGSGDVVYVEAVRAVGASDGRVMRVHVLPNVLAPVIVQATLNVGQAIIETAGLSFLGLGTQPPTPDWGNMLSAGRSYLIDSPWIATFPGLAILVTVLAFNLMGDALRDALDPRLR